MKKLAINKETIRLLSGNRVEHIVGGVQPRSNNPRQCPSEEICPSGLCGSARCNPQGSVYNPCNGTDTCIACPPH